MRKDEQIIAMYDGKMSAREVCNKLNESGVKVSYHYTANVIKSYKNDNVHTTTDNVHFESDNVHNESDNVYTSTDNICTLLSQIVTKLSQIEARLEALELCNTRARKSTSNKSNTKVNLLKHSLSLPNTEGTSTISEGTYDEGREPDLSRLGYEDCGLVGIDDADPDYDTYQAEDSEVGYEDNGIEYTDIPPTDGITQTPTDTPTDTEFTTDDYQMSQVEYADIPPTDGITTATVSQAPVNTTTTITKGEYWASWKRFRDSVSTLTPEERDEYYHQYIANLHKLYAGQELATMRTKLHNQYVYLCDQAAKPFIPDQTAVITMPETDGTMQWCRDYMMASRQMMALNSHAKAQPKEYGEYYASTIRDYMRTHGHITDDQKAAIDGLITRYLTPDAK